MISSNSMDTSHFQKRWDLVMPLESSKWILIFWFFNWKRLTRNELFLLFLFVSFITFCFSFYVRSSIPFSSFFRFSFFPFWLKNHNEGKFVASFDRTNIAINIILSFYYLKFWTYLIFSFFQQIKAHLLTYLGIIEFISFSISWVF